MTVPTRGVLPAVERTLPTAESLRALASYDARDQPGWRSLPGLLDVSEGEDVKLQ